MAHELLGDVIMSLGYNLGMRAVMLEVPEELLEDRRRKGIDRRDEVWAGVLHMVPPPAMNHSWCQRDLFFVLARIAERRGLEAFTEPIGVFDPVEGVRDYRVPDLVVAARESFSARGIEGTATLVVEILSPNDESRDKLPFYARVGVREVWLIAPTTRAFEIFVLEHGALVPSKHSALGIELATVDGKLRIRDGSAVDEV